MSKITGLLALGAVLIAASGAYAGGKDQGRFSVTNDTTRVVECNFLVDGKTLTYLKVHPAKTYFTRVDVGRAVALVCMRGKEGAYNHLKLDTDYRFVAAPSLRVDLKEAKTE